MRTINGYTLTQEFTNNNAGMCRWSFADKDGKSFFIKEFLSPKYPDEHIELSENTIKHMRRYADEFYNERKRFYDVLRTCRKGNIIAPLDFFRAGSYYYIITERMNGPFMTMDEISALPDSIKMILLISISYSMKLIHEKGIVHSDLKPDNIFITPTQKGHCTAKIIDFDSGFFAAERPDKVVGDQVYMPPESVLVNAGYEVPVSEKADVYALGILFHQYWTGKVPGFDIEKYHYISNVLLDDSETDAPPKPEISDEIPAALRTLIDRMISLYEEDRPSSAEVWEELTRINSGAAAIPAPKPAEVAPGPEPVAVAASSAAKKAGNPFRKMSDTNL